MRRRVLLKHKEVKYLNVTPVEIQWVTIYSPVYYEVESNTDWWIE